MKPTPQDIIIFTLMCLLGLAIWCWIVYAISQPREINIRSEAIKLYYNQQDAPLYQITEMEVIASAYTARKEECDDTPDITASGKKAKGKIIANNCLEFGTPIEVLGQTWEVQDRMNKKYSCQHIDLLFEDLEEALKFGRQKIKITIYQ